MLADLKEKNKELKEKLGKLRNETKKVYEEAQQYIPVNNSEAQDDDENLKSAPGAGGAGVMMTQTIAPSASSRRPSYDVTSHNHTRHSLTTPARKYVSIASVVDRSPPSVGVPDSTTTSTASRRLMSMSDRAKLVRGETSKRIESLLTEWKEFKDSADEEIRRRSKNEQSLHEIVFQKQREKEELEQEVSRLRALNHDQKMQMSKMSERLDADDKNKTKLMQLEMQMASMKRRTSELEYEMKSREEALQQAKRERDVLLQQNEILRQANEEQRNRIDSSEQEVNQTQLELEILEDMVKTLNEKKNAMTSSTMGETYLDTAKLNHDLMDSALMFNALEDRVPLSSVGATTAQNVTFQPVTAVAANTNENLVKYLDDQLEQLRSA